MCVLLGLLELHSVAQRRRINVQLVEQTNDVIRRVHSVLVCLLLEFHHLWAKLVDELFDNRVGVIWVRATILFTQLMHLLFNPVILLITVRLTNVER